MYKFFVPKDQLPTITGSDVHHLRDVLRFKVGDFLELLDGSGKIYQAEIAKITKDNIVCKIISEKIEEIESKVKVTLVQALPKGKKMDFVVQKCTELGVQNIIPMTTERSVAKAAKIARWQKIAQEAAEQCGRTVVPEITPLTKFEDVLKLRNQFDIALIPWELEKTKTLKEVLRTGKLIILIGPEGGFSQAEIECAIQANFLPLSLGKRILRSETAGMALLAMISYEFEL